MTTPNPTTIHAPAAVAPVRTLSVVSFALGLASVVFSFTFFVPIAAIVLGFVARPRETAGRVFANWGIALGFVMLFGWVLLLVLGVAVFAPLALLGLHW
jgi:hypothetical protein